jgi:hypothetical protein
MTGGGTGRYFQTTEASVLDEGRDGRVSLRSALRLCLPTLADSALSQSPYDDEPEASDYGEHGMDLVI